MANFIITTQKPTASELAASKSKTPGQGMEDAFNALMSHKEASPVRAVGEDANKRHDHQRQRQDVDVSKKAKDRSTLLRNNTQQARGFFGHMLRPGLAQPLAHGDLSLEALVQSRMQGDGGQQQEHEQGDEDQSSQAVQATLSSSSITDEVETGSIFDEIDLTDDISEPLPVADDVSVFNMTTIGADQDAAGHLPKHHAQIMPGTVPGDALHEYDDITGAPVASAEEAQLKAALEKSTEHYPEGSVGRALKEGKLDPSALKKLFEQWTLQRQQQRARHATHVLPHSMAFKVKPLIVPQFDAWLNLQQEDGADKNEPVPLAELPDAVAKIYQYLKQRMIDSIWSVKGNFGLSEGVTVDLKGDMINGSRFFVKKINNIIHVSFFIQDQQFYELAQTFETQLSKAIQTRCEVDAVHIRYQRIDLHSSGQELGQHGVGHGEQSLPEIEDQDDDLWG